MPARLEENKRFFISPTRDAGLCCTAGLNQDQDSESVALRSSTVAQFSVLSEKGAQGQKILSPIRSAESGYAFNSGSRVTPFTGRIEHGLNYRSSNSITLAIDRLCSQYCYALIAFLIPKGKEILVLF